MKKLILLSAIAAGAMFTTKANAQIGVSLGLHFGGGRGPVGHVVVATPPPVYTAPVIYNDYNDDDYYYLPDVDAYYDVTGNVYFYNDGSRWVSAAYLPGYRDYNWRTARRFEIRANRPYLNHSYYSARYNVNRGGWNNEPRRYDARPDYRRNDNFGRDNHYNGRPDNHFDRGHGNNMPHQGNRPQGGGFSQPAQGGHGRGGNNGGGEQHFTGNRSQGGPHRMARS